MIYSAATISIPAGSTVFLEAIGADATYTIDDLVLAARAGSTGANALDTPSMAALNASYALTTLANRHRLTKGPRIGRLNTASMGAADHTTHVQTVLECPFEAVRIGILNNVQAPLTNVRAYISTAPTLGANNSSTTYTGTANTNCTRTHTKQIVMTGTLTAATSATISTITGNPTANWPDPTGTYPVTFSDGSIRNVTFTSGAATMTWTGAVTATATASVYGAFRFFTVNPGNSLPVSHQLDTQDITWLDWFSFPSQDRTDGGTLPVIHVRIEVPYNSGANTTIPVYYTNDSTMASWESEGSAPTSTVPYGRPYRMRVQATLGVTTVGNFTSTTLSFAGVPFVIQYIPKEQVEGITIAQLGDSIDEGNPPGGLKGNGIGLRIQRDHSTPERPIEHCLLTVAGGVSSRFGDRANYLLNRNADILPEIVIAPIGTPNEEHASVDLTFTAALTAATSGTLTAGWGGTTGSYTIYFSDSSYKTATLTNGSTAVSWTGAVTATANALATTWGVDLTSMRLNRALIAAYCSVNDIYLIWRTILPTNAASATWKWSDIARRNYNAELMDRPATPKSGAWDAGAVLSGGLDADGQEILTNTGDNLHPNDAGNELLAADIWTKQLSALISRSVSA